MSSIRCKIGVHDWSLFGKTVDAYGGLTQFRECLRCGRLSYASCYGNQAKAKDVNRVLTEEVGAMPVIERGGG